MADSGGDPEACKLRTNAFKENKPHGFMILFSIDNRASFENVDNWVREVQNINETVPIILVACKRDLRENTTLINQDLISVQEIKEKAETLALQDYIETSAITEDNSVRNALVKLVYSIN